MERHELHEELEELEQLIIRTGEMIMAAIDDLNTSVTNLTTVVDQAVTALTTDNNAAISAAAANVDTQTNKLNAALASTPPPA